jgi:hypothetical protein
MSKTYLFSVETFKTMGQGALGAMTFGAYHQFVTNKIMELNNENINLQQKYYIDKHNLEMDRQVQEMNELKEKINKMENRRRGWLW